MTKRATLLEIAALFGRLHLNVGPVMRVEESTMRWLVVDDDVRDLESVTHLLVGTFDDVELRIANTVETYVQALAAEPVDFILTEHQLGWIDAFGVLRDSQARWPGVPVLMLTGSGSELLAVDALQAGMSSYIPKAHMERLVPAVHGLIERGKAEQALYESERRLTFVAENSEDNLFLQDLDLRYVWLSKPAHPFTREDYLGRTDMEMQGERTQLEQLMEIKRRVLETGKQTTVELPLTLKGEDRHFEATYKPWRDDAGRLLGLAGYVRDITDQKRGEVALHEREELLRFVASNIPDTLFFQDLDLRYTWIINPADPLAASDVIGKTDAELLPPEEAERLTLLKRHVMETGSGTRADLQLSPGGITRWYEAIYEPAHNADGQIVGVVSYSHDITHRKQVEAERERLLAEIQQQAAETSAILEAIADGVVVYAADGRIRRMNSPAQRLLPYSESMPAQSLTERAQKLRIETAEGTPYPLDALPAACALRGETVQSNLLGIGKGEHEALTWVVSSAAPILARTGEVEGAVATFSDVTPLLAAQHQLEVANSTLEKQALELESKNKDLLGVEEALRESRQRLAWTLDKTGVGVWLNAMPFGSLNWDERTKKLFFVEPDVEPTIELFWSRVHPDDIEPTQLAVEQALRDHTLYAIEHRVVNPETGELRWLRSIGQATYAPDGTPTHFDGINYDITERKQVEQTLRESEALYRAIARHFPDGAIYIFDHDLRFRVADGDAAAMLGYHREGLEGHTIWEATDEQTWRILEQRYPRVLAGESLHFETPHKGRILSSNYVPIRDEQDRIIAGMVVSHDITERKGAEEALRRYAAELEALNDANRLLLQEINHRVKNNLTAILGLIFAEQRRLNEKASKDRGMPHCQAALSDLGERVRSLATAHTLLSASGWRSLWVEELVGEVIQASGPGTGDSERIVVDVTGAQVRVTPEQAHHLALVIGELTTNTIKYGGSAEGLRISVHITLANGEVGIVYHNSGPGYPEKVLAGDGHSVGLGLVRTIVTHSLRGAWSIWNDAGPVTEIRFPADLELNKDALQRDKY
jgi:PAS domain S-box-containing protein